MMDDQELRVIALDTAMKLAERNCENQVRLVVAVAREIEAYLRGEPDDVRMKAKDTSEHRDAAWRAVFGTEPPPQYCDPATGEFLAQAHSPAKETQAEAAARMRKAMAEKFDDLVVPK